MLAADAVHDLQILLLSRDVRDEVEEIIGLAVEAQRVEAPQHEGAVADPRVAVVPVALAADGLGQRRGRRREQRARRAVRQPLEGQRAALQVALPWVLGELAVVDPLAPEVGGALDALERLVHVRRGRMLGPELLACRVLRARPSQRCVGALALAQRGGGVRAGALETDAQVRDQAQRDVAVAPSRDRFAVARARVLPFRRVAAVVERRLAVEAELDAAHHALGGAQQDVLGLVVGRRPAVRARPALAVVPGADAQRVADDEPAGARPPGGLDDERARQVAAPGRHADPGGAEPEVAGAAVEDRRENARAVWTRQAHPLHAPAGRHQAVRLAVGEERIFGDGRKRAGDPDRRRHRPRLGRGMSIAVRVRLDGLPEIFFVRFARQMPYRPRGHSIGAGTGTWITRAAGSNAG